MFAAGLVERIASPEFSAWGTLVAAPFIGSFLGVLVRRLPAGRPVAWVRSHCENCGTSLAPRDLVPLLSWLALRGHCRYCRRTLGLSYPAIELAALCVAGVALFADQGQGIWLDCLLGWWLLTLGWIDLRSWLLPDALTLPLVLAGLAAAVLFDPASLFARALGAALGYLGLSAVAWVYRRLRGREGVGMGDAKLLAAAGAWLGVMALPQVILAAALAALTIALLLRVAGVRLGLGSAVPFGPFLALAFWLLWLFGPI